MLETRMLEIDGGVLEVFVGAKQGPPLCSVHPTNVQTPDGGPLAEVTQLIKVNPRALGNSSSGRDRHDLTIDQLVEDLEALRHQFGFDRWWLNGYSGGSEVMLRYALRYPQVVTALILGGAPAGFRRLSTDPRTHFCPDFPRWQALFAQWSPPAPPVGTVWSPLEPGTWVCSEDGRPRLVTVREPEEGPTERTRVVFEEILEFDFDAQPLDQLRIPTLVLHGRHDAVVPVDYGERLATTLPTAELVIFEQSGHVVFRDEPETYREVIHRFIEKSNEPQGAPTAAGRR